MDNLTSDLNDLKTQIFVLLEFIMQNQQIQSE